MKRYCSILILLTFCITETISQTVPKVHIFEQFTSTNCPLCGNRNPEFYDEVLEPYNDEVIHIAYHNNIPRAITPEVIDPFYNANTIENNERTNFYGVRASPSLVLNGKLLAPAKPLIKGSEVASILNQTSPLKLNVSHFKRNGNFNVKVDAELLQDLPNGDYKLYIAVVEKEILFCTFFEYVFDNVFRAFFEDANRIAFNLNEAGATETFEKKIPWDEDWEYSMLYAVAFVQNTATKEIINAGTSKIIDSAEVGRFSNEEFKLTSKVYHSFCGAPFGSIELGVCVGAYPSVFPDDEEIDITFKWSNGATTQNLIDVPPGTYTVEIKDNNNDTLIEQTFEIRPSEAIEVEEIIAPANASNQLGNANIIASGSYGGFTIEWNDGNTNFNRNDLSKGEYYYLVTDSRGCQRENGVTIGRDFSINDVEVAIKNVSCNGAADGNITIDLLYDEDILLIFKDDDLVQNPAQLPAGQYNYKVIDSFDDVLLEAVFEVTEPLALQTEVFINDENEIVSNVIGGTPPYSYLWNDGTIEQTITAPLTYNYEVTATDANGCKTAASLTFTNLEVFESEKEKVKLFPNPVKSGKEVNIFSSYKIDKIQLYHINGSLVKNEVLLSSNAINVESLAAGIYVLKAVFINGVVDYIKLLVE